MSKSTGYSRVLQRRIFVCSLPTDENEEDEEFFFGVDLLHKMDVDDISELRKHFFDAAKLERAKGARARGLALDKKEFVEAMEEVAGGASLAKAAEKLFDMLDTEGEGRVIWEQVLDGIMENTETTAAYGLKNSWRPVDPDVKIYSAAHCKVRWYK